MSRSPRSDRGVTLAVGLASLAVGLALWWYPAAFMAAGAVLVAAALAARDGEGGR